jgi:hypothetical protein
MAISRFQSSFKVRTDLMDNITPNNVVQREVSTPAGEWKPAAWLPTVWQNEKSKDYFTISSGKVVSFDASGRIVPSGLLRKCLAAAAAGTVLSYSANDVEARVIDITTGKFVTGAKDVSLEDFIDAVLDSGWVIAAAPANDADRHAIAKQFISAPVGVAAYDVYVWAGDDPANLHYTNYQKQHLIQFFTDIQMRVPHVCEGAGTVDLIPADPTDAADLLDATELAAMPRYAGLDMSNVVGYRAAEKFASHTSRSPVSLTIAAGAAWNGRLRSEIALLGRAGDYFLDGDAGIILFYEAGGDAAPVDADGAQIVDGSASGYDSSSTQARMIHLVGAAKPGDIVTFDPESNFVVAPALALTAAGHGDLNAVREALNEHAFEQTLEVGRVLELIKEPRGLLERVRTGFQGDEFAADAKMPGSATGGFSDLITLSEEVVADEIAVINIKVQ